MTVKELIEHLNSELSYLEVKLYDVNTSIEYEISLEESRKVEGDTLYIPMYPLENK